MSKFPPEWLQKVRSSVNIIDVIGEQVVLRKSGANHIGLCPFHGDRSPSFSVSETKQVYHCHACKESGDVFTFVMKLHGLSFPEAIEELAERGRVALPKGFGKTGANEDPEALRRRTEAREKLALAHKLNYFVATWYRQQLAQLPSVARYLQSRGVTDELSRSFYLGAAPGGWDSLTRFLIEKKAPLPLAVELGLIRPSPKAAGKSSGPGYFDLFRDRAMFPILDMRGKVAGFGGRALGDSDSGPKYLNSPESQLFQKSKLAFGLFQAQKHVREKDELILVEGYFDVLALHAAGFQNVVASCGTALTVEHLAIFRRFASRITVLFDGDKAGISATERAMELGLDHGMILYGAAMPEGLDPDELLFDQSSGKPLAEGKDRMAAILADAKPLLDVRIDQLITSSAEGPEARAQALKTIGAWLGRFKDPVGKDVRIQEVQRRMGATRQLMEKAMGGKESVRPSTPQSQSRPAAPARPRSASSSKARSRLSPTDGILLRALTIGGDSLVAFQAVRSNLPPNMSIADLFDYAPAREFVESLLAEGGSLARAPETVSEGLLDPQVRSVIAETLVEGKTPYTGEDFTFAMGRAQARAWARFSQRIKAALAEAEAKKDAGLQSRLMKEYLDVQRKMKEFISFYDEA